MEHTNLKLHGKIITDSTGKKAVILSMEEFELCKKVIEDKNNLKLPEVKRTDFDSWKGLALQCPENPNARFKTEDDLWE